MREPLAKKNPRVHSRAWGLLDEECRVHLNKVYGYMFERQEEFIDIKIPTEEWAILCTRVALLSAQILKRGKNARYSSRYR